MIPLYGRNSAGVRHARLNKPYWALLKAEPAFPVEIENLRTWCFLYFWILSPESNPTPDVFYLRATRCEGSKTIGSLGAVLLYRTAHCHCLQLGVFLEGTPL